MYFAHGWERWGHTCIKLGRMKKKRKRLSLPQIYFVHTEGAWTTTSQGWQSKQGWEIYIDNGAATCTTSSLLPMSTVIRSTQHLPPVNRWVAARIWAHSYPRASMTRRSAFKIRYLSSKPLNPAPIHHQNAESKDGKAERTVTAIRPEQSEEIRVRKFATTKPLGYTPPQISQSNDDAPFWNEFRASCR